jgi:enterochelin esterase-like enzyme
MGRTRAALLALAAAGAATVGHAIAAAGVSASIGAVPDGPSRCLPTRLSVPSSYARHPGRLDTLSLHGHTVLLYVPAAADALPEIRLPVVYFLHGAPGAARMWIDGGQMPALLDRLISAGQLPPLIAVFPDEQGRAFGDSWWGNTALGDGVEAWLMSDLVPTIDDRYCTLGPRYRGIAGFSAGGFGAVNLAIHELGLFSWAAGYSGVYTAPREIFGPAANANSPQLTASSVPADQRFPLYLGAGAQDREFLGETLRFIGTVATLHWAPLRTEVVVGDHSWQAWSVEVEDSLRWLGQLWKDGGTGPVAL